MGRYVDIGSIVQVIGGVYLNPNLLDNENYHFTEDDFTEPFHKIIFGSIYNLHALGAAAIDTSTIEDYLEQRPTKLATYKANNGAEYLEKLKSSTQLAAFDYYYKKKKKMTLFRMYKEQVGLDLSWLYDIDNLFDQKKKQAQEDWLDNTPIEKIADQIDAKIEQIKAKYIDNADTAFAQAGDGVDELIDRLMTIPELGIPMFGDITNTITILAGQGALDGKEGPIKKGNNLYEGVKTNKNSLVIVPYGTGYGHTTVFIHEGISAATRLGNFMVGGSSRKITNSIVGYSLGGMAAYRTVAQNNGLYNKLVAVNSFMQADMEKNGGSWQAFNNCEIVLLEAAGDKFVDGAIGTLKKLQRNGINMNNVHVYSNDRTMIGYSKRYLNDSNINDWSVHNSELKGWSTHNHGIEMIKSSGILNYLSS